MPNPNDRLIKSIAEIARRTSIKENPIVQGTVIGRNPDGSLIVDDGRGGCVRQAPAANVRIGQRIVLGTEPGLGAQTQLAEQTFDILLPTPCPDDPRLEPPDVPTPGSAEADPTHAEFISFATSSEHWADRDGFGADGNNPGYSFPLNSLYASSSGHGEPFFYGFDQQTQLAGSYFTIGADPVYRCRRVFYQWPTEDLIPGGATVTGLKIVATIARSNPALTPAVDGSGSGLVRVCASTAVMPGMVANAPWSEVAAFDAGTIYAQFAIADAVAVAHVTDGLEIDLSGFGGALSFGAGALFKVALLTEYDRGNVAPPNGLDHYVFFYPTPKLVVSYTA